MCKRILAALLCAAMLIPAAGCGQVPADTASIVLTDQTGRAVALDKPADTVVSGYYISSYAMVALGLKDHVVGLEKKADTRPIYSMAAPEFLTLPAVGTMKELNVEAVTALKPDLVILPAKHAAYADTLADVGIQTMLVAPESHEALCEMLTLIGQACGAEDRAKALIEYYDTQRKAMADKTKDAAKPTVYMAGNATYLSVAPERMYQASLIRGAGAVNAAASLDGDHFVDISYESILQMNPEVIIIPAGAEYTKDDILADTQLSKVKAVINGRIYTMPSGIEEWDSPIPSGILGLMWMTSVLHEDVYAFADFKKDAAAFYAAFYGIQLDTAKVTK